MFDGKKEIARLVHPFRGDGGDFECLLVNSVDYSEAVAPSFIGAGSHHASFFGIAADDNRFASQFWVVPLFNRRVEGVHVNMNDFAILLHSSLLFARVTERDVLSILRHFPEPLVFIYPSTIAPIDDIKAFAAIKLAQAIIERQLARFAQMERL